MLAGLALVGVPILIHLINRRRYDIKSFAAIHFLKLAYEKRRKRLRMESLLLLLLRCMIVIIAALAMALPFVSSDSPLAGLADGPRDVVLMIDRSGSMARELGPGTTLDDQVLDSVRRRLRRLSDDRGDAVSIVFMGRRTTLPAPIGAPPSVALEALEGELSPVGGVADIVAAARFVKERVRPARPGRLDVEIFTDLQAITWGDVGSSVGDLLAPVLERGGGRLRIVPVGDAAEPVNLGVVSLTADDPLTLVGEPLGFTAVLENHSNLPRNGVLVSFFLDGEPRYRTRVDVGPRAQVPVTVRLRIDEAGPHHVQVTLDKDVLPFDDTRTLALDVRQSIDVLVIDGAPAGANPLSGAAGYLLLAMDPGDFDQPLRFRAEVQTVDELERSIRDLSRFDAIVMTNVGGVSAATAEALAETVRSGTPLLYFMGDRVDAQVYADRLEPLGLLPATVGVLRGDPDGQGGEDYVTLVLSDPAPKALELFADPRLEVLLQVPVLAWMDLEPREESHVLASFVDALGKTRPAIVEGQLGRGRILMVATSADDSWSLLPRFPATWVPFVHELLASLTAADPAVSNVPVGDVPTLAVRGVPTGGQLTLPSGAMRQITHPEYEAIGQRSMLVLAGSPLDEPGGYRLDIETAEGTETRALAAVPDAREGELDRIDVSGLDVALGEVAFVLGEETPEELSATIDAGDGNLAMPLLWLLVVLVLAESLLARWMGQGR
jgi:hypothetical protein